MIDGRGAVWIGGMDENGWADRWCTNDDRLRWRGRSNHHSGANRLCRGANNSACARSKWQATGTELWANYLPLMH